MPFEFDTASDEAMSAGDSTRLEEEGCFHFQITNVDESPVDKKNTAIDGFKVEMAVLEGPQIGRTLDLTFWYPKQSASEKANDWAISKITAFLEASGLTTEADRGKKIKVELQDAVSRQVIANVQFKTNQDGTKSKFLELAYANIYHIDNPNSRAAKCNKSQAALALVPAAMRRDPKSFASAKSAPATSANVSSKLDDV